MVGSQEGVVDRSSPSTSAFCSGSPIRLPTTQRRSLIVMTFSNGNWLIRLAGVDSLRFLKSESKTQLSCCKNYQKLLSSLRNILEILEVGCDPQDVSLFFRFHHLKPGVLQVLPDVLVLSVHSNFPVSGQRGGFKILGRHRFQATITLTEKE